MIDFTKGQTTRHWLVCQAVLGPTGILADGLAVWGQPQGPVAPGQELTFVLCYIPPVAQVGTPTVGKVRISEVYCRIFDATGQYNDSGVTVTLSMSSTGNVLQQSAPATITGGISTAVPSLTSVQKIPATASLSSQWATPFTAQLTPTGGGAAPGTIVTPTRNISSNIPIALGPAIPTSALPGTSTGLFVDPGGTAATTQTLPVVNMTMPPLITTTPADIDISPTRNASVETGTVTCALNGLNFNLFNPPYITGTLVLNQPNGVIAGAGLYVVNLQPDGTYPQRDVINDYDAFSYDYLDLATDQYFAVQGVGNGFTSRELRLKLPEPIVIGPGQALVVTYGYSYANFWSGASIVPFIRCLIEEVV
jgi:hypothetical protein